MDMKEAIKQLGVIANGCASHSVAYEVDIASDGSASQLIRFTIMKSPRHYEADNFISAHGKTFDEALANMNLRITGENITENLEEITDDMVTS